MSRSLPEWIGKTPDTPVPPRVRVRNFDAHGGVCHVCTRKIPTGDAWETDHVIALINQGENRESNLAPICSWCHDEKTGRDVAEKSKVYKVRAKHVGAKKRAGFKGWRKFDGTVVRRT